MSVCCIFWGILLFVCFIGKKFTTIIYIIGKFKTLYVTLRNIKKIIDVGKLFLILIIIFFQHLQIS